MIRCGHCKKRHDNIDAVRACHTGDLWSCDWLCESNEWTEDGERVILECGADAYELPGQRGTTCAAGHENIYMEVADREGIAYVTEDEAAGFMRNNLGMTALLMDGTPYRG